MSKGSEKEPMERQRALTIGIMDKISRYGSLVKACKAVKWYGGVSGADRVSIEEYGRDVASRIKSLHKRLLSGTYQPREVLVIEIPKPNGGVRLLGIPTVEDRIVQQSIQMELQVVYDDEFSEYSYGFHPGRSAAQAVVRASEHVKSGKAWTVDIDLKSFFDEINQDRLMSRLGKSISDKGLLKLIRQYLRSLIYEGRTAALLLPPSQPSSRAQRGTSWST
jgi:RNA-directed DNA polymerase